ncbi:MAG: hypothetical protein ACLKAK_13210 [Alkaliphilus sp.]
MIKKKWIVAIMCIFAFASSLAIVNANSEVVEDEMLGVSPQMQYIK